MRFALYTLGLASTASAHTAFTTMYIDGENQGDGTCVRMPIDGRTSTGPIYPVTGDDMACGRDGEKAVPFVCPASSGSTLTFQFRESPNYEEPGSIDESHQGPCAVYVKKVEDMFSDSASGPGWFKIWEDGYNADTGNWCVDTLIQNNGLLSVDLPTGLPAGNYLVRPEILALQQAYRGDPQFYAGCAQIVIQEGPQGSLNIPSDEEVSIPGYVEKSDPGLSFDLYNDDGKDYVTPGPAVYRPESSMSSSQMSKVASSQVEGAIPQNCVVKNANWCAKPIPSYTEQQGCWDGVNNCWAQSKKCWASAPITGSDGCDEWADYCTSLGDTCNAGQYNGPPAFKGKRDVSAPAPGPIPEPYNNVFKGTIVGGGGSANASLSGNQETSPGGPKDDAPEDVALNVSKNKTDGESMDEDGGGITGGNGAGKTKSKAKGGKGKGRKAKCRLGGSKH